MDLVIMPVADKDNEGFAGIWVGLWMTQGEEDSLKVQVDARPDVLQSMHTVINLPGLLAIVFGLTGSWPRKLPDRVHCSV